MGDMPLLHVQRDMACWNFLIKMTEIVILIEKINVSFKFIDTIVDKQWTNWQIIHSEIEVYINFVI